MIHIEGCGIVYDRDHPDWHTGKVIYYRDEDNYRYATVVGGILPIVEPEIDALLRVLASPQMLKESLNVQSC